MIAITTSLQTMRAIAPSMIPLMWRTFYHLRIVDRLFPIEYCYILMRAQRHFVGIQKACYPLFAPNKIIFPEFRLRHHKLCGKHTLAEKNNGCIWFGYAQIFLPQWFKRNNAIPATALTLFIENAIRQIADNTIHTCVRNLFHSYQAILIINLI